MELETLIQDKPSVTLPVLDDRQLKIVNKVRELWTNWRNEFDSTHKDRIRENYRRYHNLVESYDDMDDKWRGINGSPIRLAFEYAVVESYKVRILRALLGDDDFVKILPKKSSTVENAKLMNELVKHYLEADNYVDKMMTFLDQGCLYGSCPWFVWQMQKKEKFNYSVMENQPINVLGIQIPRQRQVQKERERIIENRPTLEIYDIESVGFDVYQPKYEDSPYHIVRQIMHRSQLAKIFPTLTDYFNSGLLDWDGANNYRNERMGEVGKQPTTSVSKDGMIEVLFYFEPEGNVAVFSNKMLVESPNESQLKEVFTGLLNIVPFAFEPYGGDLVSLEKQYADISNELINIDVDSTKLATSLMTKVKRGSGADLSTIFCSPGNQWLVEEMDDVQEVKLNYQPGSALGLLEYISNKTQQQTGATDASQGTPINNAKFATDIQRMVSETNLRFWMVIVQVKKELKKIVRAYVKHIQEYVAPEIANDPIVFMVTGKQGFDQREINNPQDLMGDFDYHISFSLDDLDDNFIRGQLLDVIKEISTNPMFKPFANPEELLKLLFRAFPKVKEIELLAVPPQQQLETIFENLSNDDLMNVIGLVNSMVQSRQAAPGNVQVQPGAMPTGRPAPRPARRPMPAPADNGLKLPNPVQLPSTPAQNEGRMF